jgi:hypothetical protein
VSFAATMRPDGAVGSRDDVTARDMHGMILDDAAGGQDKSPGETVADSESRALLKTARGFGVQQKVQQRPPTVGTQHHRQHTDLAGTAAKRPSGAASSGRRGSCPPRARWGGRERGTTATRGQHGRHPGLAGRT